MTTQGTPVAMARAAAWPRSIDEYEATKRARAEAGAVTVLMPKNGS
jgi:hypothetical protein